MFTLKKKCNFILVLIKLVSHESDKIQRRCDQKCVLRAGESGRHRASPGDHVKKMSRIFLCVDQKGINFLGSAQLSLLKSDKR